MNLKLETINRLNELEEILLHSYNNKMLACKYASSRSYGKDVLYSAFSLIDSNYNYDKFKKYSDYIRKEIEEDLFSFYLCKLESWHSSKDKSELTLFILKLFKPLFEEIINMPLNDNDKTYDNSYIYFMIILEKAIKLFEMFEMKIFEKELPGVEDDVIYACHAFYFYLHSNSFNINEGVKEIRHHLDFLTLSYFNSIKDFDMESDDFSNLSKFDQLIVKIVSR